MRILSRHFAVRLASAFSLTLIAFCSFFVIIDILTNRLSEIVEFSVTWTDVAFYYASLLPGIVVRYHLAGFSVLIAVLVVLGAAARRGELTAMLAAGIPLRMQAAPAFMLAFALTLALLAASQWLTPASEREARQFEAEYFSETSVTHWGKRQPVSWSNLAGGWTCHITKFNRQALSGEQVFLLALRENREEQIRARRIFWDDAQRAWVLEDGSWAIFEPQPGIAGNSAMTEHRITQELAPLAETPEELFEPFDDPARFATSQLPGIIKSAQARHVPVAGLQVEYHARFAGALLPAVVVLLGAPLAARATRGGRSAAITLALGLALGYLMLFGVSQNLGRMGRLDPISAAWLANGVFSLAGVGLLRWAPN